MKTTKSDNKR